MKRSTEEFKSELCAAIANDCDVQRAILDVIKRASISNPEIRLLLSESAVKKYVDLFQERLQNQNTNKENITP